MPAIQIPNARILIWAKTYPELSKKYFETVCTAGVLEDGSPVRLYPVSFRYISEQFKKYQWITATLTKNAADSRPESYKIDSQTIKLGEVIPTTKDEWGKRAEQLFKNSHWQFSSVEELQAAQKQNGASLAVVEPKRILDVKLYRREEEDAKSFEEKLERLRRQKELDAKQLKMFEEAVPQEMKHLDFLTSRILVKWECFGKNCATHEMQILDWEIAELQRKEGEAKALEKVRSICDLGTHATKFFLGNLFQYPSSFTIVGIWYPLRAEKGLFG